MIRVELSIVRDSHNSYPCNKLEIEVYDETVGMCIGGGDGRSISINKSDLVKVLKLIEME